MSEDVVRMQVNPETCIAGGQCELLAPDVFEIDDDEVIAVVQGDGRLDRKVALEVIDRCPSGAISIVEPDEAAGGG